MFKLDNSLLEELGLGALPPTEKNRMLNMILEKLEERVGMNLASKMSEAQLDEFEQLMPVAGDNEEIIKHKERQALTWLEANFPNYKEVVGSELEKLKVEIKQSASQILAASQTQPTAVPNGSIGPIQQPVSNPADSTLQQPPLDPPLAA